jgi:drug/metabolite transporter (DMT)-like permease
MAKTKLTGIYFAVATTLISGVSIFLNKFAVTAIEEPLVFTTVKNAGVALVVLIFLLLSGEFKEIKKLEKRQKVLLALIGIVGGSIPFYLFFTGLSLIPAINAAIIHKTLVLWVGLLAIPFLKEELSKIGWLAVFTLFVANVLVGGFKGFELSRGEFYVLAATLFWAVETILAKKVLPRVHPDILVEARMGIGAIVLLLLSIVTKPQSLLAIANLSLDNWLWVVLTTGLLVGYVVAWYRGLKYAPATVVTGVMVGSILVTNVLSAIFVTHTLNMPLVAQSIFIALSIAVLYRVEVNPQKKLVIA